MWRKPIYKKCPIYSYITLLSENKQIQFRNIERYEQEKTSQKMLAYNIDKNYISEKFSFLIQKNQVRF